MENLNKSFSNLTNINEFFLSEKVIFFVLLAFSFVFIKNNIKNGSSKMKKR